MDFVTGFRARIITIALATSPISCGGDDIQSPVREPPPRLLASHVPIAEGCATPEDYVTLHFKIDHSYPISPTVCRRRSFGAGEDSVVIHYVTNTNTQVRWYSKSGGPLDAFDRFDTSGWTAETGILGDSGTAGFTVTTNSSTDWIVIRAQESDQSLEPQTFDLCLTSTLEAPSNLTATSVTYSAVSLSWQVGASASTRIHREASGSWQQIGVVDPAVSSYQDTALPSDPKPTYKVDHQRSLGDCTLLLTSAESNEVNVLVPPRPLP